MQRDIVNDINVLGAVHGTTNTNAPVQSGIVPFAKYDAVAFLIITGVLADADATFAAGLTVGDDPALGDGVALTDATNADDLIGTLAAAGFTHADGGKVFKVGYKGSRAYGQLTVTPTGNADAAGITIVPVLGHPRTAPTPNPPA